MGRTPKEPPTAPPACPRRERLFVAPAWDWAQSGDTGWWVRPDWKDVLLRDRGLRLDEWKYSGRVTTVKTGPHRAVYRVDLAEGSIFVKHFLVPDVRAMARQWFRRGKGRNEGRRALKLRAIGVETIEPIALGEQRKRNFLFENYLITRAIPETVPLDEFIERRLPRMPAVRAAKVRQSLARAIGELTAHLHDAGFVHQDFHPGNLLVRFDADDRPHLALIDLDALRTAKRVGWRVAMKNSRPWLNHYLLAPGCSRGDRCRFLHAYLTARGIDPERASLEFASVDRGLHPPVGRAALAAVGEAVLREEQVFQDLPHPGRLVDRLARPRPRRRQAPARRPDRPARPAGDDGPEGVADDDRRRADALGPRPADHGHLQAVQVEEAPGMAPEHPPPDPRLARLAGGAAPRQPGHRHAAEPRDHRADDADHPRPAGDVPRHDQGRGTPSPLSRLHGRRPARSSIPRGYKRRRAIRSLTKSLAMLLRTLHERSISDRDLKASNIMIEGDPATGETRLSLIDLVGVQLLHPIPRHRRLQNLARLQVSLESVLGRTRTDSLRFLRAYLVWGLSPLNDWKGLWRQVARLCDRKRERNRHRGRLLS